MGERELYRGFGERCFGERCFGERCFGEKDEQNYNIVYLRYF